MQVYLASWQRAFSWAHSSAIFSHVCLKRSDLLNQPVRPAPGVLSEGLLHLQRGPWYLVKQVRALPPGGAIPMQSLWACAGHPARDTPTLSPGREDTGAPATGTAVALRCLHFLPWILYRFMLNAAIELRPFYISYVNAFSCTYSILRKKN